MAGGSSSPLHSPPPPPPLSPLLLPCLVYFFHQHHVFTLIQRNVELENVGNCLQKDSLELVFTSFVREYGGGWTECKTLISCSGKDLKCPDNPCSQRSGLGQLTVHF